MDTPCSPRRMSIKGSFILLRQEESCQAARRDSWLDHHNLGTSFVCGPEGRSDGNHPLRRTHPRGVSSSNVNCFGSITGTTMPMGSPRLMVVGLVSCKRKLAVKAS